MPLKRQQLQQVLLKATSTGIAILNPFMTLLWVAEGFQGTEALGMHQAAWRSVCCQMCVLPLIYIVIQSLSSFHNPKPIVIQYPWNAKSHNCCRHASAAFIFTLQSLHRRLQCAAGVGVLPITALYTTASHHTIEKNTI